MSAILAALITVLWAALGQGNLTPTAIGEEFFLTVAACWVVLVPAKLWGSQRGDGWSRRVVMMVLGMCIGLGALWLDGWSPFLPGSAEIVTAAAPAQNARIVSTLTNPLPNPPPSLIYFSPPSFPL